MECRPAEQVKRTGADEPMTVLIVGVERDDRVGLFRGRPTERAKPEREAEIVDLLFMYV